MTTVGPSDAELPFAALLQRVAQYERTTPQPEVELRLAILRDYAIEQLVPYVKYYCFAEGLRPVVELGRYDSVQSDLLDGAAAGRHAPPDLTALL